MSEIQDSELKRFETALGGLVPRPANLDRDQLMFDAGRAAVRRGLAWPLAALGMTVVAGWLTVALLARPGPERIVEFVQVPAPVPPSAAPVEDVEPAPTLADEPSSNSYLRLHHTALQHGMDQLLTPADPMPMLPPSPPGPMPTAGTRGLPGTLAITGDF